MILGIAQRDTDGRHVLVVGLSAENVRRLRANEPIHHDLGPHGIDLELMIFGGRGDEDDLRARLSEVARFPGEETT